MNKLQQHAYSMPFANTTPTNLATQWFGNVAIGLSLNK